MVSLHPWNPRKLVSYCVIVISFCPEYEYDWNICCWLLIYHQVEKRLGIGYWFHTKFLYTFVARKYFWPTDCSLELDEQWLFLSIMQQILQNESSSDFCLVMKVGMSEQSFLFQEEEDLGLLHLLSRYKDYVCRFIVLDLIFMIQRLLQKCLFLSCPWPNYHDTGTALKNV